MDKVAVLLNEMVEQGIIADYAVFGAVAQMRYTEAVVTLDALANASDIDHDTVLSVTAAPAMRKRPPPITIT